jgi:hypothetical protein
LCHVVFVGHNRAPSGRDLNRSGLLDSTRKGVGFAAVTREAVGAELC